MGGFFIVQIPPELELCYNGLYGVLRPVSEVRLMPDRVKQFAALAAALATLWAAIMATVRAIEDLART